MVPQQIRAAPIVQSLSDWHDCGQLAWQMPPQQRGVVDDPLQSLSPVHCRGHCVACRQIDFLPMAGSRPPALPQQTSPAAVSQSVFDEQVVGQLLAAVHIGVE
jgi:hypothetical protein